MKELLEGRRLGFALRPALANIALGLGLAVSILDVMSWAGWGARDTNAFLVSAYWLCGATAIVALLGFATAVAEMADVPDEESGLARLDTGATIVVFLLYAGSAFVRSLELGAAAATPPAFLMALAGLLVLFVGTAISSVLYAAREWEEIEEVTSERHGRRRAASR